VGADQKTALPAPGNPVQTACGGQIHFEQDTPTTIYRGRRVYFCLPACLEDFARDPATSCLADDMRQEGDLKSIPPQAVSPEQNGLSTCG